ncbi:hypothetical protein [Sphingomonas flavalba]|uniref:hypothetical protein n=1 Tax=Sphingomonas flavalba TaxID=2559804 RepID=UPI00109DA8C5|nr:hypothetical protein [Sphingomonas flavalba]
MTTSTSNIWIRRAAEEARAALAATTPAAARLHRGLAAAYHIRATCGVPVIDAAFLTDRRQR